MKKSSYSDSQILAILNQAEARTPVTALGVCAVEGFGDSLDHHE